MSERHPSAVPVPWLALSRYDRRASKPNGHVRSVRVTRQSWYEARAEACVALQVEPWQLTVVPLEDAA